MLQHTELIKQITSNHAWVMFKNTGKVVSLANILATMALPPLNDKAPIHRARVVTEWFDEHENNVNHMPWPSQSPDFNPI